MFGEYVQFASCSFNDEPQVELSQYAGYKKRYYGFH